MRHLAIICEHASPLAIPGEADTGRQSEYVAQVAERAVSRGYAVDVFTRRTSQDLPEMVPWRPGVRIVHVDAGPPRPIPRDELLPYMNEFAEWVLNFRRREQMRYDVLHANYWTSGYVAAIIKRALSVPFVVTFHALGKVRRPHESMDAGFPTARPIIEERVIQEADAILASCPQEEHDLCTMYEAPSARIVSIPCGVDAERFHPASKRDARASLGLPLDGNMLLSVGRLVRQKGMDDVIRSLGALKRKHRMTPRLVIVGDGLQVGDTLEVDEVSRLRRMVRDEGVEGQVTFIASCAPEQLHLYYSAADVFLTAPSYDASGLTALEAMACGTAVVGTRVGGLKLSVQHGQTGLLVPPQDPSALADAAARLLKNSDERSAMGRQGMMRVQAGFSWADLVTKVTRVYDDVVERSTESEVPAGAPVLRIRPHTAAAEFAARASA